MDKPLLSRSSLVNLTLWGMFLAPTAQAGIKIAGRNTNNLRYADDTTLMAENEEELKSLLMKVKEESEKEGHSPSDRIGTRRQPMASLSPTSRFSLPAISYCGRSLLHPTRESVEEFPPG